MGSNDGEAKGKPNATSESENQTEDDEAMQHTPTPRSNQRTYTSRRKSTTGQSTPEQPSPSPNPKPKETENLKTAAGATSGSTPADGMESEEEESEDEIESYDAIFQQRRHDTAEETYAALNRMTTINEYDELKTTIGAKKTQDKGPKTNIWYSVLNQIYNPPPDNMNQPLRTGQYQIDLRNRAIASFISGAKHDDRAPVLVGTSDDGKKRNVPERKNLVLDFIDKFYPKSDEENDLHPIYDELVIIKELKPRPKDKPRPREPDLSGEDWPPYVRSTWSIYIVDYNVALWLFGKIKRAFHLNVTTEHATLFTFSDYMFVLKTTEAIIRPRSEVTSEERVAIMAHLNNRPGVKKAKELDHKTDKLDIISVKPKKDEVNLNLSGVTINGKRFEMIKPPPCHTCHDRTHIAANCPFEIFTVTNNFGSTDIGRKRIKNEHRMKDGAGKGKAPEVEMKE